MPLFRTDHIRLLQFLRGLFARQSPHRKPLLLLTGGLVLSLLALKGFVEIADEVQDHDISGFDRQVAHFIQSFRSDALTPWMVRFTHLGERPVFLVLIVLIAGAIYWQRHNWLLVAEVSFILLTATLLNRFLKQGYGRIRPDGLHLVEESSYSFPSGHSMGSMAFYGFLIFLIWRLVPGLPLRLFLTVLFSGIILLVGASRVYLGVHYPSDVLAAYAAGLFWLALCVTLFRGVRHFHRHWRKTPDDI